MRFANVPMRRGDYGNRDGSGPAPRCCARCKTPYGCALDACTNCHAKKTTHTAETSSLLTEADLDRIAANMPAPAVEYVRVQESRRTVRPVCPPEHKHDLTGTCYSRHKCGCDPCLERDRRRKGNKA